MFRSNKSKVGATLIETLLVLTVTGTIGAITAKEISELLHHTKRTICIADVRLTQEAIECYQLLHTNTQFNLASVSDVSTLPFIPNYIRATEITCPLSGVGYKINPSTMQVFCPHCSTASTSEQKDKPAN